MIPALQPTKLDTNAGFEPVPDSYRLPLSPVRLPFDFQRTAKVSGNTPRLLESSCVGAGTFPASLGVNLSLLAPPRPCNLRHPLTALLPVLSVGGFDAHR